MKHKKNMIPIEDIRKNYKNFDDQTILKIAKNPKGLRKEIAEVLNEEIQRRNLDISLMRWVKLETNTYEGEARENLLSKIKNSICPDCNHAQELKGYQFTRIYSFLIDSTTEIKTCIVCETCASELKSKSIRTTALYGWWSLGGLFSTPFLLISYVIMPSTSNKKSREILNNFIDENTGRLRSIENDEKRFQALIKRFNKLNQAKEQELYQ